MEWRGETNALVRKAGCFMAPIKKKNRFIPLFGFVHFVLLQIVQMLSNSSFLINSTSSSPPFLYNTANENHGSQLESINLRASNFEEIVNSDESLKQLILDEIASGALEGQEEVLFKELNSAYETIQHQRQQNNYANHNGSSLDQSLLSARQHYPNVTMPKEFQFELDKRKSESRIQDLSLEIERQKMQEVCFQKLSIFFVTLLLIFL